MGNGIDISNIEVPYIPEEQLYHTCGCAVHINKVTDEVLAARLSRWSSLGPCPACMPRREGRLGEAIKRRAEEQDRLSQAFCP